MIKTIFLISLNFLVSFSMMGQNKPAYLIFNAKGKKVSYKKMLKSLAKKDIILFGEFHNDPIGHWLELELARDIQQKRPLILAAEMFETDNQGFLTAYINGDINEEELKSLSRLWSNYGTDYKPLVEFAKEKDLFFIASNVPRRYAKMVMKEGFEVLNGLPEDDQYWIAPLPFPYDPNLPGYQKMLEMAGGPGGENFPKAQAIKDATMAASILKFYKKDHCLIHYNGSFHSDYFDGIFWYLKQEQPELEIGTISTVKQINIKKLNKEHLGKANFIICVPENMTTTY